METKPIAGNYLKRTDAERIARDSFRAPLVRFGQGSYANDYDPAPSSKMMGRVLVLCAVALALAAGAAWMIN